MNHDYGHCLDANRKCPKECFRKQLNEDLKTNPQPYVSWMHFVGTKECKKGEEDEQAN